MGRKIEGYWNCPACRNKAIEGRYKECPHCGKPRGEDTKFYMIEKDKYVDDSVVEKGPDWFCDYCGSYNPYSVNFCLRCGSPKEESNDDYFSMREKQDKKAESISESEISNSSDNIYESENNRTSFTEIISNAAGAVVDFISEYRNFFLIIIAILTIIGTLTFIFYPRKSTLEVTSVNWERSIEVEEYKTVRESGWSIPAGGRLAYSQEEYYGQEQVLDHYETVTEQKSERYVAGQKPVVVGYKDLGNGYFEEIIEYEDIYETRYYTETYEKPVYKSVAVYKTKYYYDIERWVHKITLSESGSTNPFWPETNLSSNERIGNKSESYKITGINQKNKEKTYSTSYELWNDVQVGDTINIVTVAGTITRLEFKN